MVRLFLFPFCIPTFPPVELINEHSSGDTGVAASLVLHGTPPFRVSYRMQREKEHPRELHETFSGSRGEMTLQPPRSGRYVYTFTHITDANYNKVELDGPTIDQVVHPLATAHFVQAGVRGREKATVNSCSGNTVDVEVELEVSWRTWRGGGFKSNGDD